MALTKHQKLARGLRALLEALDLHHQKTANTLNALQLHFYEPYKIIGAPEITEQALQTMMNTHRCGLKLFSPNKELRIAAQSSPLIGCIIYLGLYPLSRVLVNPSMIPWKVETVLPSQSLSKLNESMLGALLYCASENEMSEWIDWFERENKTNTFTNQFLAAFTYSDEISTLENNLSQPAFELFDEAARKYHKNKLPSSNVFNASFAPNDDSTIAQAYEILSKSFESQERKNFRDFQSCWRNQLEKKIFANTKLPQEQKQMILEEKFLLQTLDSKKASIGSRWETSRALDRQTYGSFIRYFAECFLKEPQKRPADGEITLLLWIMVYISLNPNYIFPIKRLLQLTTADVIDECILIDGYEVDISCGLADLLREYTGGIKSKRQQKLFPNLSLDKLEDYFRRASLELLPPGSLPALPEAFLTFPHSHKYIRMLAKTRHHQQKYPSQICHDLISRHKLKQQLIEKSQLKNP